MFDENGKLTTELEVDCERENVWYTDRIGAVGVLTCLSLFENVVNKYKNMLTE
jgi:5,10-methylene-tetrahydrofolate dehydrogenase/methenyl tetrahydrofolate cyclohydrolase